MRSRTLPIVVALMAAVPAASAQTYVVEPGMTYTTAAITQLVLGSQMTGMDVLVRFTDGSTSGGTWGLLGVFDGVARYGVQNDLFSMSMRGSADTGGPSPSEDDLNLANFTPAKDISGFVLRGAPANVLFDRTFGGLAGTPGSGTGRDVFDANNFDAPGTDEYRLTVRYRNQVRLGAAAAVGDLFETLDVTIDNTIPQGENYSFFLDTDLARDLAVVPEPGTCLLTGAGLAGVLAVRRRRRS